MSAVTYSSKCYTSVCVGCELLFQSVRRDQLTCSSACRVSAHRNGRLKAVRKLADDFKTQPELLQFAKATSLLRPDLDARIASGEADFDDIMPDLDLAFNQLIMRAARMTEGAANDDRLS
ncbi:hypothetical protein [Aminobacter niigataensis]|uniref:hypothetical protein n=1 Tax=Aminobacter niigataensis TaxID=83265 RepID=UPI0024C86407|nr:hypothetical protein [Aminobacter niigataensis]CAI2936056.1 conserved protein of unknown function [Aminobacter niigataensis]